MKNTLKERLEEYIQSKGLNNKKFEEITNLSNGFVSKIGKNLRSDTLEKIIDKFPDFPKNKILYGFEEYDNKVIGDNNFSNNGYIAGNINHQGNYDGIERELKEIISSRDREISHLREIISNKEEIISLLKQQISNSKK